ncbi:MAG: hypothetical protein EXR98_05805 [Gemmataceae bacterium]|nr:hypothetical protein [Gemmataceae bacterium]
MAKQLGHIACLLFLLALVGCKSLFGNPGVPADPIFGNRKPVETKALAGPPSPRPFTEPTPPVNSYGAER